VLFLLHLSQRGIQRGGMLQREYAIVEAKRLGHRCQRGAAASGQDWPQGARDRHPRD